MSERRPSTSRTDLQSGMTLIEIMITLVVLSILVLGISGLWANVTGDFLALTTRQKAIFVLNGEMARLSAFFRFNQYNFSFNANNSSNYKDIGPERRDIFPPVGSDTGAFNNIVLTAGNGAFNCGDSNCAGNVLHFKNAVDGEPRNYVWIDQARKIVGELSWRLSGEGPKECSSTSTFGAVSSNAECKEIIIYLRFPLRYVNDTTPPKPTEFGRVETLILTTIVGRRP